MSTNQSGPDDMTEVDLKWLEGVFKSRGKQYDVSQLLSVDVESAVADGENYVSKIYRLTLAALSTSGQQKQCSLILKRKIDLNSEIEEVNKKLEIIFNKEYQVYNNVLSKLGKYLKNGELLWPNCLESIRSKDIYFEDLKATEYKLADRCVGLDNDHCLLAFRSLAQLHAASYMAISKGEIDITPYQSYIMIEAGAKTKKIRSNCYAIITDVIRKEWPPDWSTVADKVEKMGDILPDVCLGLGNVDENGINVLNHGDTWVNNFMFKYDSSGKPISFKFVDFQLFHYNSFAFDMCYLLNSSVDPDVKRRHLDEWIQVYCQTFSERLEEHGCRLPSPSPDLVRSELSRLAPFQLSVSFRIRPVIMIPPKDYVPMSELLKDTGLNSKKRRLYNNPTYVEAMKKDLPTLLSNAELSINKL